MADRAITQKQYAQILGIGYSTFRSILSRHPEELAPSFQIGGNRRWWESTVVDFHKSQEQGGPRRVSQNH